MASMNLKIHWWFSILYDIDDVNHEHIHHESVVFGDQILYIDVTADRKIQNTAVGSNGIFCYIATLNV